MAALGAAEALESGRKMMSSLTTAKDVGRGGSGLGIGEAEKDSDVDYSVVRGIGSLEADEEGTSGDSQRQRTRGGCD
ncbi:hypothetical protein [Oryza sativa Japonica Group]|uniref:Uncharacterized protein n=1 Tax=Oryza sativa subsp. japonica TaxID=39947 RepID=Q5VR29_ORYSJ|nr:hypothetical protein [Oryza sativa Japonica Group]